MIRVMCCVPEAARRWWIHKDEVDSGFTQRDVLCSGCLFLWQFLHSCSWTDFFVTHFSTPVADGGVWRFPRKVQQKPILQGTQFVTFNMVPILVRITPHRNKYFEKERSRISSGIFGLDIGLFCLEKMAWHQWVHLAYNTRSTPG